MSAGKEFPGRGSPRRPHRSAASVSGLTASEWIGEGGGGAELKGGSCCCGGETAKTS